MTCWCFTSYEEEKPPYRDEWMRYLVFQQETCPDTGRTHWQGYLELLVKKRLSFFKEDAYYATPHFEKRRGTRAEAIAYCKKEESAVPGTVEEHGVPGEDSACEAYASMVSQLKADPVAFAPEEHLGVYLRTKRSVDEWRQEQAEKKARTVAATKQPWPIAVPGTGITLYDPSVLPGQFPVKKRHLCMIGPASMGKTAWVRRTFDKAGCYRASRTTKYPFERYLDQEMVWCDDWYPERELLIELCEYEPDYEIEVAARYKPRVLKPGVSRMIVITHNDPPVYEFEQWFNERFHIVHLVNRLY